MDLLGTIESSKLQTGRNWKNLFLAWGFRARLRNKQIDHKSQRYFQPANSTSKIWSMRHRIPVRALVFGFLTSSGSHPFELDSRSVHSLFGIQFGFSYHRRRRSCKGFEWSPTNVAGSVGRVVVKQKHLVTGTTHMCLWGIPLYQRRFWDTAWNIRDIHGLQRSEPGNYCKRLGLSTSYCHARSTSLLLNQAAFPRAPPTLQRPLCAASGPHFCFRSAF